MFVGQVQSQGPLVLENENSRAVSRHRAVTPKTGKGNNQGDFTAITRRSLKPHLSEGLLEELQAKMIFPQEHRGIKSLILILTSPFCS